MKKNILFKRFSFYFLAFISAAAVFLVSSCSVTRRDPDSPPLYNDPEGLKAVDGDPDTYWVPRQEGAFTQITFETPKIINVVEIIENYSVVRDYHIEAWIDREWVKIYENDLIEGYYCAVVDEVETSALRLYIDRGRGTRIKEFNAKYLSPVEYDREFVNMSYITQNQYYHDWVPAWYNSEMGEKTFSSLTDLYMLGVFRINAAGEFVISLENYGRDNSVIAVYPARSEQAEIILTGKDMSQLGPVGDEGYVFPENEKGMLAGLKSVLGTSAPDLWFSLTILSDTDFGGCSPYELDAFNDSDVRSDFISTVVEFAKKYGFSGVDIDWEYPGTDEAWKSYACLIEDLSAALHAEGLLFSSAQTWSFMNLSAETLNKFDRINLMSYDQSGQTITKHHSTYQVSTVQEIQKYLDYGISPEKLVLGLAYYSSPDQTGWSTIFEQMQAELEPGEKISLGENFFRHYTFNNVNLIRDRTLYAITQKIGGVFSWHICCDLPWDHYASLARPQSETVRRFIKYIPVGE